VRELPVTPGGRVKMEDSERTLSADQKERVLRERGSKYFTAGFREAA